MALDTPELIDLVPGPLQSLVRRRELRLRRPVAGPRHGLHRASRVGLGHDFHEHRAYSPGDDLRQLDWRAAARRERLVMRQAEGEEQLSMVLVVDASANMGYVAVDGAGRKWSSCVGFAAMLAALAVRQGDRVGAAFGRGDACSLACARPSGSRDRVRALAHELAQAPTGGCPWTPLLSGVGPLLPRRSLVIVLSDFLDPEPARAGADEWLSSALAQLAARGHELLLVQVLDRDELEFPWMDGRLRRFEDSRGVRAAIEGTGRSLRVDYLPGIAAHQAALARRCETAGLLLHTVVAGRDDLPRAFLSLLERLAGNVPTSAAIREFEALR